MKKLCSNWKSALNGKHLISKLGFSFQLIVVIQKIIYCEARNFACYAKEKTN